MRLFLSIRYNERVRKTALKRKRPLKTKKPLSRSKTPARKRKPIEKYKCPKWYMKILPGGHGKTPAQKRLWKVVSDTYRKEDWEHYGHKCPLCLQHIEHWKFLDLAHWQPYSCCNKWMKYERVNLLGICKKCHAKEDTLQLDEMRRILEDRYGNGLVDYIRTENNRQRSLNTKIESWHCVEYVEKLRPDLVE